MRLIMARTKVAIGFSCLVGAFWMSGCSSSHSSNNANLAGNTCTLTSDCQESLVCTAGRCHAECAQTRDCASGQRCMNMGGAFYCLLQVESKCVYNSDCPSPAVCAVDLQCRSQCKSERDCAKDQVCTPTSHVCAETSEVNAQGELAVVSPPADGGAGVDGGGGAGTDGGSGDSIDTKGTTTDASASDARDAPQTDGPGDKSDTPVTGGETGGTAGTGGKNDGGAGKDGGTGTGGKGGSTGTAGNSGPCTEAQTKFGFIAKGDSNPKFTSGVGVRTAKEMIIFNGYSGPDPTPNADAGTATTYYVYSQAFDPDTGNSKGPAQLLFNAGAYDNGYVIFLDSASIAPTGEVLLLYKFCYANLSGCYRVNAAFLSASSADAGAGGLQLTRIVQADVAQINGALTSYWSAASNSFVASWTYLAGSSWLGRVRTFTADGRAGKGDVDQVPTNRSENSLGSNEVGGAGNLVGVGFTDSGSLYPLLTVLDGKGNQVGSIIPLESYSSKWMAVGGTATGFVTFWDSAGVASAFVPISADGNSVVVANADGGTLAGFRFSGTTRASWGRALNDDVGGAGGVGLVLHYSDRISFAYVGADGTSHVAPASVIAKSAGTGDIVNISNFGGSFGLSLYDAATHFTQMAVSSCSH
jgi:hypothetical protein